MAAATWKEKLCVYFETNPDQENEVDVSLLNAISSALIQGDLKLYSFIEALGPQLSNVDNKQRCKGMKVLSSVLLQLPTDFLTDSEVDTLMVFFSNKLDEKHMIMPYVFKGLLALSKCENTREGIAAKIAQSVFKEGHVQSYMQPERYTVYKMIAALLETRLDELKKLSSEFVYGFIQTMDGEKDPQCLSVVFRLVPIIVTRFDLGPLVEELFEVASCYFPVEFTPPPDDPRGITREDLAKALENCLASTPKFAKFCLPLLLEKMDSDLVASKLDAFSALVACCKVYGPEELKPFLPAIWSAVRKEAFLASTDDTETAALSSLTSVVRAISTGVIEMGREPFVEEFINSILKECEPTLCKSDLSLMQPCAKLLRAAASASDAACYQILSAVFPLLLQQFTVNSQVSDRKCIIEIISGFFSVAEQFKHPEDDDCPVYKYRESLLTLLFSILMDPSDELRTASVRSFAVALDVQGLTKENHVQLLAAHLRRLLVEESNDEVRVASTELLSKMSLVHPVVVKSSIIDELMLQLNPGLEKNVKDRILESVKVSASSSFFILEHILPSLMLTLLKNCLDEGAAEFTLSSATCVLSAVESHATSDDSETIAFLYASCLRPLVNFCIERLNLSVKNTNLTNPDVLKCLSRIMQNVSQKLPSSMAEDLVHAVVCLLVRERKVNGDADIKDSRSLKDFATEELIVILTIFRSVACSQRRDVAVPHFVGTVLSLLTLATEANDDSVGLLASQCIASLANKQEDEVELLMMVDRVLQRLVAFIEDEGSQLSSRIGALRCWIWLTKGLVLRGHRLMAHSVQQLLNYLENDVLGSHAAEGFGTIHLQVPEVLTEDSHAVVKIMFHQRFFIETAPSLLEGYQKASETIKPNYLTALCLQLKFVPKVVLKTELPPLLPVLLQALQSDSEQTLMSTLLAFEGLLSDSTSLLEKHLHNLLPQLIQLAKFEGSMSIRKSALCCLKLVASLPDTVLLPYRQNVIQQLSPCLDDKKRLIRKEAVLARCSWFLIGQPGR